MDQNVNLSWKEFLDPDVMRPRLVTASVYIAGFEALKNAIVSRIREFYTFGFDETGSQMNPKYEAEVLKRHRSPVYASLAWLREKEVVSELDLQSFERLKACRNKLAHELLSTLGADGVPPELGRSLPELFALFRKIETWWLINVEIPSNPELDEREIDENEAIPGTVAMFQVLLEVALGDDEQSRAYHRQFEKYWQNR